MPSPRKGEHPEEQGARPRLYGGARHRTRATPDPAHSAHSIRRSTKLASIRATDDGGLAAPPRLPRASRALPGKAAGDRG